MKKFTILMIVIVLISYPILGQSLVVNDKKIPLILLEEKLNQFTK